MTRQMTELERAVLKAMLSCAEADGFVDGPRAEDRRRWVEMIDDLTVTKECGCGSCPSIALAYKGQPVNEAQVPDGHFSAVAREGRDAVIVFIYNGWPGYVEVVPSGDESVPLPKVDDLVF